MEDRTYYYAEDVAEELKGSGQLAVFGAGQVAYEVVNCLLAEPYRLSADVILVSEKEGNPDEIMGIPVAELEKAGELIGKDAVIVIAVMGKYLDSICESLEKHGYHHILPLTFESDRWSLVQGDYYRNFRLSQGKEYLTLEEELEKVQVPEKAGGSQRRSGREKQNLCRRQGLCQVQSLNQGQSQSSDRTWEPAKAPVVRIYTARCHADRRLQEDLSRYSWEIPIQAGAALTDQRLCEVRDDCGENISHKNKQYCELTALYWIWKHDTSDYAGLGHYRRHFELDEGMLEKLACSDIDVVLTIPILNFPSVEEVYRHDHVGRDWEVMLEAVRVLEPDYIEWAEALKKGNFYYGYNMVIARKEILNEYCAWLFPLLEYCEERCGGREGTYQQRYMGFLAERLMGIYFLKHEDKYKIVHVRKHFVEG